jgi:sec-independent protein translocase protein TatA
LVIGDILQPTHLLFVLVIALLVLGPKRLPEVGRALGRGLRDFRNAINTDELRDQMVSSTSTESPPQVDQPSAAAPAAPVGQPVEQPPATLDPASSVPSTDDSPTAVQEPTPSPEPTTAAPTPERVP